MPDNLSVVARVDVHVLAPAAVSFLVVAGDDDGEATVVGEGDAFGFDPPVPVLMSGGDDVGLGDDLEQVRETLGPSIGAAEPVACAIMTDPQVFALCWGALAVAMGVGFAVFAKQHADVQVRIQRCLRMPAPSSHRTIATFSRVFGVGFAVIGVVVFIAALTGSLT